MEIVLNEKYGPMFDETIGCRYFLLSGGRGSGKSFALACRAGCDLVRPQRKNALYLRQTMVSAHISIIPEFHARLEATGYGTLAESGRDEIVNRISGSRIYFRGITTNRKDNEANLKSLHNLGYIYIEEAQELTDEAAFDRLDLSLRDMDVRCRVFLAFNPTSADHWLFRRFYDAPGIDDEFNGVRGDVCYIHTDYRDNAANLPEGYIRLADECRERDFAKWENIWLGRFSRGEAGALWTQRMIEQGRVAQCDAGTLERVVVGIDPAVTGDERSDMTGIVVAGTRRIQGERHYYVIQDASLKGSPHAWATAAVSLYRHYKADRVVAEVNQGGDMVEATIRNLGRDVAYRAVRATRGKLVRAEPIAELYERGLVHHVGAMPELERQMTSYAGAAGQRSPDRMDALVWALTELSGRGGNSAAILA